MRCVVSESGVDARSKDTHGSHPDPLRGKRNGSKGRRNGSKGRTARTTPVIQCTRWHQCMNTASRSGHHWSSVAKLCITTVDDVQFWCVVSDVMTLHCVKSVVSDDITLCFDTTLASRHCFRAMTPHCISVSVSVATEDLFLHHNNVHCVQQCTLCTKCI